MEQEIGLPLIEIMGSTPHDENVVPRLAQAAKDLACTILSANVIVLGTHAWFWTLVQPSTPNVIPRLSERLQSLSTPVVREFTGTMNAGPLSGNPRWEVWAEVPDDRPGLLYTLAQFLRDRGAVVVDLAVRAFHTAESRQAVIHVHFIASPKCDIEQLSVDLRNWAPPGLRLRLINGRIIGQHSVPWAELAPK